MKIDIINQRILALLEHNARISASQIARQVNLSRPAVQERIAAMEDKGIIEGYHTQIAPGAGMTRVIIVVKIASRPCGPALQWLHSLEGVSTVLSLSGDDIDALVYAVLPNLAALSTLNDTLATSPLICTAKSHVVLGKTPQSQYR